MNNLKLLNQEKCNGLEYSYYPNKIIFNLVFLLIG